MSDESQNLVQSLSRLGTAALSDALDSLGLSGGIPGLHPRSAARCFVGPAFTVKYRSIADRSGPFRQAGGYIDRVQPGQVIVIDNEGTDSCTTWGGILTEFALQRKIAGTIVHGAVRDAKKIAAQQYPLFSSHVFMQSAKNRKEKVEEQMPITLGNVIIHPGDLICADEDGCLAIPHQLAGEVLLRARRVEATEAAILEAIRSGLGLEEARRTHGYDQPWREKV